MDKQYKIIIADDEKSLLNSYPYILPWDELGFSIVKLASNGIEVISYLSNNSVDIIITDIDMPKSSGLDIARYVYENKLDIKIIIVSGYNDFEYARTAMQYQVENYLLKPIDIDDLTGILNKMKEFFLENEKSKKMMNSFKEYINKNIIEFCEKIFYFSANYRLNIEPLLKNIEFLGITKYSKTCRIIIDQTSIYDYFNTKWNYDNEGFLVATNQILNLHIDNFFFVALFDKKMPVNIFVLENAYHSEEEFQNMVLRYINNVNAMFFSNEKTTDSIFEKICYFPDTTSLIENMISSPYKENVFDDCEHNNIILKAIEFIEENYENDISLDDVSKAVYLNKNYFCKLFKSKTGIGFKKKLISVRMERAKEFLENTDLKISLISQKVGYNDIKLFSRQFQLIYNDTPAAYRIKLKRN